jgi:hypothetical protein
MSTESSIVGKCGKEGQTRGGRREREGLRAPPQCGIK